MALERLSAGAELIDLLDRVLDKGIFVEASSRLDLASATLTTGTRHIVVACNNSYHDEPKKVTALNRRRAGTTRRVH